MNAEIKLPADLALLKRCRKMGFSAKQAEKMVMELFRIESNMQNDTNAKFKELIAEIKEQRSEIKAEVKACEDVCSRSFPRDLRSCWPSSPSSGRG